MIGMLFRWLGKNEVPKVQLNVNYYKLIFKYFVYVSIVPDHKHNK